ncbi:somatostatin receptor type 5-like [Branchiostoma floridae]|uniref:Somatostatin receptor type 5-like n=1 Tax=Branchiostoma floridae TaxID=7739 RepID=A0A9J7HVZ4_BRAFL|nr:somatostatin receptor type 5-like [Branchiostoma floridae]
MGASGPHTTLPAVTTGGPWNFSTTNSTTPGGDVPDKVLHILLPVLYSIICCIGLTGNTIVIYVVARMSRARTVANSYILNLAIADELLLLSMPFICVMYVTLDWPFGPVMCKLVLTADTVNQFASAFCLTAMSIDRYQAVVHPMTSRGYRTIRRAVLINVAIWILALVVVSPSLVFTGLHESEGNVYCNMLWPEPAEAWGVAFIAYSSLLGCAVPLTIITVCAVFIVRSFRRHRHSKRRGQARDSRQIFRNRERTITRVVFAVVVTFFVCVLPFYIFNIVNLVSTMPISQHNKWLFHFVASMSYGNSCLNPLIYIGLNSHCRKNVWELCCSWTGLDTSRSTGLVQVTSIRLSSLSRAQSDRR